jgi:integrase
MRRSFNLALRTGLRFAETRIGRSQVDWTNRLLHIEKPKGGRKRAFSIPIYESVEPMLREWWQNGAAEFWTTPAGTMTALTWTKFFRDLGLPHLCFHCTRVTFISRGARAGISEGMMMKLVNHASEEVHRVYQRLPPGDAAKLVASIPIPRDAAAR